MEVIFLHRSRGWKDFLYTRVCVSACVCACIHARSRNFWPIDINFGIHVGLVKSKVQFEDRLYRFHREP